MNKFKIAGSGILAAIAGIAIIVLLALGIMWGTGTFSKETANFRGGVAATEKVFANGANRIAAYEKFYNLCASVEAKEATIKNIEAENANPLTSDERKQTNLITLTALKSSRSQAVTQYNADANKTDTQANFQASNLPYMLSETGVTVCSQ